MARSTAELCPDAAEFLAALREAGEYISPRRAADMYSRLVANADVAYDLGDGMYRRGPRRRGSRPVDRAVGDRVATRLTEQS